MPIQIILSHQNQRVDFFITISHFHILYVNFLNLFSISRFSTYGQTHVYILYWMNKQKEKYNHQGSIFNVVRRTCIHSPHLVPRSYSSVMWRVVREHVKRFNGPTSSPPLLWKIFVGATGETMEKEKPRRAKERKRRERERERENSLQDLFQLSPYEHNFTSFFPSFDELGGNHFRNFSIWTPFIFYLFNFFYFLWLALFYVVRLVRSYNANRLPYNILENYYPVARDDFVRTSFFFLSSFQAAFLAACFCDSPKRNTLWLNWKINN